MTCTWVEGNHQNQPYGVPGQYGYVHGGKPPGAPPEVPVVPPVILAAQSPAPPVVPGGQAAETNVNYAVPPEGYGTAWNSVRFSNTTDETLTIEFTVAAGQALPQGQNVKPHPTDPNKAILTIEPHKSVDVTFAPDTSVNFRRTSPGEDSVWNQGELFFRASDQTVWGNMSYIYGANSNMRIFSSDGQHAGYLGDIIGQAPPVARVGDWGIVAPYDGNPNNNDPNNPNSATGGPDGAKNAGSTYLYSVLQQGEGYVGRGRPAEVTDYDDASSKRFGGNIAVVF